MCEGRTDATRSSVAVDSKASSVSSYYRLSFELPVEQQDLFSVELFALGALGLVVEEARAATRLVAYCSDPLPEGLALDGESWAERGIRILERERFRAQDWLAEHRAACRPIEIGERFLVDPREPGRAVAMDGRVLLRVPARRAFGTGSHESTRLILEWLEDLDLRGLYVLDLGAGSGILSLAAMSLGAGAVVGLDIDPVASFVSREIVRLNAHLVPEPANPAGRFRPLFGPDGVAPPRQMPDLASSELLVSPQNDLGLSRQDSRVRAQVHLVGGELSCLGDVSFDLALVNILPSRWLDGSSALARVLTPDGYAIVSGLSKQDADEVGGLLAQSGLEVRERRVDGEWAALGLSRGA